MNDQPSQSGTQPRLEGRVRDLLLRAGSWAGAGFMADKLLASGQLVILARLLAPEDFGLMAASAATLLALMTLSEVGIDIALITRREVTEDDLVAAWTLSLMRAAALTLLVWITAGIVADAMHIPQLALFLRVHACALLLQAAGSPALVLLIRNLAIDRRVRFDLLRRLTEVVATVVVAIWLRSAWALLAGQMVGFATGVLFSYRYAPFRPALCPPRVAVKRFGFQARHVNLAMLCTFGVTNGGEFVIGRMLGTEQLGLYQIALTIPGLLGGRLIFVMNQVGLPGYAMLQREPRAAIRAFAFQSGAVAVALFPLVIGMMALAPWLIPLLFGPRWHGAVSPFQVLCVYAACAALANVMGGLHYGFGRPEVQSRAWILQCLFYLATIVPMIWWWGLLGAAIALTASYLIGLVWSSWNTIALLGPGVRPAIHAVGRTAVWAAASGAILLGAQTAARWVPLDTIMPGTVVLAMGLYLFYVIRVEGPRLLDLWRRTTAASSPGPTT